jgi:hypothetical protein
MDDPGSVATVAHVFNVVGFAGNLALVGPAFQFGRIAQFV